MDDEAEQARKAMRVAKEGRVIAAVDRVVDQVEFEIERLGIDVETLLRRVGEEIKARWPQGPPEPRGSTGYTPN